MLKDFLDSLSLNDLNEGLVILVNKPLNWTSFDIVKYIRKTLELNLKLKKIKVGHAGTLDPLATGLLIICIGNETKNIYKYQELNKTYSGTFKLGETTPSFDRETEVNQKFNVDHLSFELLKNVSQNFIGKSIQKPPIFSALKKNGKRLYEYARVNKNIKIDSREIFINKFELNNYNIPYVNFVIECSKGTYIRSIANDFGKKLKSGSFLYSLNRDSIGHFNLIDAYSVE
ncbi:MAG: tRNA pseudouridine(55) synthase TruB [Bacteroidota bacterium]